MDKIIENNLKNCVERQKFKKTTVQAVGYVHVREKS